jgi:hypothetical protein
VIVLYSVLRFFLLSIQGLVDWRVAASERKFVRCTGDTQDLIKRRRMTGERLNVGLFTSDSDILALTTAQSELAEAARRSKRAESRYIGWQGWAESLQKARGWVKRKPGRAGTYTAAAVDTTAKLSLLD